MFESIRNNPFSFIDKLNQQLFFIEVPGDLFYFYFPSKFLNPGEKS